VKRAASLGRFAAASGYVPASLSLSGLRELRVRASIGQEIDGDTVVALIEALEAGMDAAEATCIHEAGALPELIRELVDPIKKERDDAVEDKDEAEKARDKADEERSRMEKERDDLEEKIAEFQKKIDDGAPAIVAADGSFLGEWLKTAEAERDAALRKNEELAACVRVLEDENIRIKQGAARATTFWEQRVRDEIARVNDQTSAARKAALAAATEAEADAKRLRESLTKIVSGKPEDAHRLARVALGGELLELHGTRAEIVERFEPTKGIRARKPRAPKGGP
jgi:hypothetical protein